jgi:hypothetical protein
LLSTFLVILYLIGPIGLIDANDHIDFMRQVLDADGTIYTVYEIQNNDYSAAFDAAINDGVKVFLFPRILIVDSPPLLEAIKRAAAVGTVYVAAGQWYDRILPVYEPYVTIVSSLWPWEPCPVITEWDFCPVTYLNNSEQVDIWTDGCTEHKYFFGCSSSAAVARVVQ